MPKELCIQNAMDFFKNGFKKTFVQHNKKKSFQFVTEWKPMPVFTCASKLQHHLLHGSDGRTGDLAKFLFESSSEFKSKAPYEFIRRNILPF